MREVYRNFLEATHMFHKLNFASILPDISRSEFVMLKCIAGDNNNGGTSEQEVQVSRLVANLRVLPPAVSRTLKGLEARGYIERFVNPGNRRNTYVRLTEAGRNVLRESEEIMETFAENVFARTDEEDLKRVCEYLYQLYDAANEEIENLRHNRKKRN